MPETGKTRVVVPERIQRGDVIRVQIVVQHPMDTGLFRDANAEIIPAYFINDVQIHYGDEQVAQFEWTTGISKDPLVSFQLRAEREALLTVTSKDNRGKEYRGSAEIKFATT